MNKYFVFTNSKCFHRSPGLCWICSSTGSRRPSLPVQRRKFQPPRWLGALESVGYKNNGFSGCNSR